ncbi:Gfo/Idh/MocA family protein [Parasulfitobacter algicola]|uniref:Gfo/Idh/MocA family oxidoreductase n=1 Tax=Parasulfitobacter algicola TaxID=2614809 RepID=A0ABX2ITG1_9RHOB|nr:Gfo/Idh/MocA family oxidoreductase [Sulfitobacter algicola]NSX53649.1 Gfo/Idh/MocA family oxidoreductase [Sulfitobacter algicola]
MTKVRVACVGAGYFSQFHYDSWARMDRVELVGSCNRDIKKARATGLPAYGDLAKMLHETQPDLLDIILPPLAHGMAIQTALDAGIKTMICQKPFCNNLAEARQMVVKADTAGAHIIIHENFRFQPWYRAIKQALGDDKIGILQQVTFRFRPGDGQGPQAYMARQPYFQKMDRFLVHETAVHWVDTFRFLLGNPIAVYADLRKMNPVISGEDAGYLIFDHATGVRALFDGNRHLDHAADNLRRTMGEALIEGTSGIIRLTGDGAVKLRGFACEAEDVLLSADHWNGFGGDCVHALQSHVIAGLLDGTGFENLADDYLTVIQIEDAIYKSAEQGKKITLEDL